MTAGRSERGATFGEVFASGEFRALWLSQVLSVAGDRLALVALTLLVYERTRSPLWAAVAYAAGFLPWAAGGLALARLADRMPRREVMIGCDVARAVLVGAMTLPSVPLPALVALLFAATSFAPPFEAARAAIFPDILTGDRYVVGTAVVQTTYRSGMVLGYAAGGAAVAVIGTRPALGLDAATFVASALLVRYGVARRPAATSGEAARSAAAEIVDGIKMIFADRRLRTFLLFGWLVAFYAVPEGVAAPYARHLGGGAAATGLILAAAALGGVLAAPVFTRLADPAQRLRLMAPFAVAACATLLLCLARPGMIASLLIFMISGAFGVYQIAANAAFVVAVPPGRRGQAFGVANAGLIVGQGAVFVLAGAAAQAISPAVVIGVTGGAGLLAGAVLMVTTRRRPPGAAVDAAQ